MTFICMTLYKWNFVPPDLIHPFPNPLPSGNQSVLFIYEFHFAYVLDSTYK